MPRITIGVPAYNGEELIGRCLQSLLDQSFKDVEILIFDDASSDRTQIICEDFAARDSRIQYVRRDKNVGALANFEDLAKAASAPYFLARAQDDVSDPDYIELLYQALVAQPEAYIAVGTVNAVNSAGAVLWVHSPISSKSKNGTFAIWEVMVQSSPCWIYGLWRTDVMRASLLLTFSLYSHIWAWDHLAVFSYIIDQNIIFVPEAQFYQGITDKGAIKWYGRPQLKEAIKMRREFFRVCKIIIAERSFSNIKKYSLTYIAWLHVGRCVFLFRSVVMQSIRQHLEFMAAPKP